MSTDSDLQGLYRDLILKHAREPRNFGKLAAATHVAEGVNPLCGDKLKIYLRVDDGVIEAARFEGSGCAVAVASASMLTEAVTSLNCDTALTCADTVSARLSETPTPPEIADSRLSDELRALDGVKEFPARVKCATLAWHILRSAIKRDTQPATTE